MFGGDCYIHQLNIEVLRLSVIEACMVRNKTPSVAFNERHSDLENFHLESLRLRLKGRPSFNISTATPYAICEKCLTKATPPYKDIRIKKDAQHEILQWVHEPVLDFRSDFSALIYPVESNVDLDKGINLYGKLLRIYFMQQCLRVKCTEKNSRLGSSFYFICIDDS